MSLRLRVGTTMEDAMELFHKRVSEMQEDLDMLLIKKGWQIIAAHDKSGDTYKLGDTEFKTRAAAVDFQIGFERQQRLGGVR